MFFLDAIRAFVRDKRVECVSLLKMYDALGGVNFHQAYEPFAV